MKDIREAVEDLRAAFGRASDELEERLKEASGNVHDAVSERVQLARDLEIVSNLGFLFEILEKEAGRALLRDVAELGQLHSIQVADEDGRKTVRFELDKASYKIVLEVGAPGTFPDGESYQSADLMLYQGRDVVFESSLDVRREPGLGYWPHPARGSLIAIRTFRPGEWIASVTECAEGLRHAQEVRRIKKKYDPEKVRELNARFSLDHEAEGWRPSEGSEGPTPGGGRKATLPPRSLSALGSFFSWVFNALAMVLGVGVLVVAVLAAGAALFYAFGFWSVGVLVGFGLLVLSGMMGGR